MQKSTTTLDKLFLVLIAVITILFASFSTISPAAFASETEYSSVMEDLSKVDDFNKDNYPYVEKDYSINVIQIAESEAKQLFVYTYQPTGQAKQLKATTVRIATSTGDDKSYHDYQLTLLNSNGVFFKYLVNGLEVKNDTTRYYDIPAIHRKYIEGVDTPPSEGQTVDEVVFKVDRLWTATTENEKVTYLSTKSDVIEIINKYVGSLRYADGLPVLFERNCYSHYVAFSTDLKIDDLKEADVSFYAQSMTNGNKEGDPVFNSITLYEYDSAIVGSGLFNQQHECQRIVSVQDFIQQEDLKDGVEAELSKMQWVLRFTETEYKSTFGGYDQFMVPIINTSYTTISEVTILRLKFETNNTVFNLGVVDNKQTGPNTPDNNQFNLWQWLKENLLNLIGAIVAIVLVITFLPSILAFVLTLPSKIYKALRRNKRR